MATSGAYVQSSVGRFPDAQSRLLVDETLSGGAQGGETAWERDEQGCTAVGDGRASPTTKKYKFWVFYYQSVRILFFFMKLYKY